MQINRRSALKFIGLTAAAAIPVASRPAAAGADVNVADLGARGDGRTDDAQALQAAVDRAAASGGGRVVVPVTAGFYRVNRPVRVPGSVDIIGTGGKPTLVGENGHEIFRIAEGSRQVSIENLRLDGGHPAARALVKSEGGIANISLRHCELINSRAGGSPPTIGFQASGDSGSGIVVSNNSFANLGFGIQIAGGFTDVRIEDNVIRHWKTCGILVRSTESSAPSAIRIAGNTLEDPLPGEVKYPIQVNRTSGAPVRDVVVTGNRLNGPRVPFDRVRNGTADQIALQGVVGFVVENNVSINGGENGIAISRGSSNGAVRGNVVSFNFGHGIDIGSGFSILTVDSASGLSAGMPVKGEDSGTKGKIERIVGDAVWIKGVTGGIFLAGETLRAGDARKKVLANQRGGNIVIEDNECIGNGLHAGKKKGTFFGIFCQQVEDITISGNRCSDPAPRKTQAYGLALAQVSRARVLKNEFNGNGVGEVQLLGKTSLLQP